MRPVRFTKGTAFGRTSYSAGEVAGFNDTDAARLVSAGCAVYADGANASEAAPKADTAPLPPPTSETGAASTSPLFPPEALPDAASERAAVQADSMSRTPTRAERRNRRG